MESADNGAPAASLPPSSQDKHGSNSPSLQLSPKNNDHQSPSQIDPALLTQLPPTAGTQSSMPLESQCSQLLLETQPNYNDSMLQTQLSRYNDHHGMDEEEDAAERQSSQHLLLTTQPTHENNKTQYYGDIDDLSVKGDPSQPNTQEYTSQLEHLSMTQQQQSLLLTQQLQQQHQCRDNNLASSKEYEKSPKQSHEDENDDAAMSSPEQPMNEQVDFLYNTQQQNNDEQVDIDDESDNDDSDNDDYMERLVEEQNLAVSLSMEVIEECEESQRCSRDNDEAYSSSVSCCNVKHGGTDCDEQDKPYKPPAAGFGFGFTNVGSGKSIAVDEAELAKADKLLADNTQQKTCNDYDKQDEPYKPPATGFGFMNVGSGKSIAVGEEEMAKADKLLAENTQQKSSNGSDFDEQDEPYKPPPAVGLGFTNVGSGRSIAVDEAELDKADKLLADDTQQKTSNDYDKQDEPYNPLAAGFGFTNVGSGRSIAVDEEDLAKADKLLAENTQQKTSNDYDKQDEPYKPPLAAGFGFTNVGSGRSIAVDEEDLAKANKLLADNTQQKTSSDSDFDEQDEPYNPPATGFGFTNVGSGKSIAVDEAELAKADKMLAADDNNTSSVTTTAAPAVVASKMTPKFQRSQQANPTTVTNPYVRKRSIDQISNACAGKSNVASAAVNRANLTAPTPSRRLVFNPYAKTGQSTTKAVVRNPYAKIPSVTAAVAPSNPSVAMPPSKPSQFSTTVRSNPVAQTVTNASSVVPPTGENQFGFKGISFSLPIAERLPSRNVSYTPAEILTVGELHQYLYGANAINDFKHLQSVRITGTLLSVAVSSSDEKDGSNGNLYSSGTFLVIGDPLETNRLQTKPLPPKLQTASSQGNTNSVIPRTVTKSRPMSILRNKHTPGVRTTQATLASTADGKPIATPVVTKQNNRAANTTVKKKPALRGGLLNNSKPKKFVYAGNKNRSSLGGGLHRKFVTPKRASTLAVPNTTGRVTSSVIRNRPLSMAKSVGMSSGRKNVKIETVIQCHPAPLVPVWIGSSLDDDGLDGSVVNDLVMVMGEIVVEHCSGCRQQSENESFTVNEQSTSIEGNEDDGQNVEENNLSANEGEKLQPIVVKNVRDAALSIAATVSNNAESTCQSTKKKQKPFCSQCVCFLSARIVKNANGTDMNLQKELLRVRREYFIQRKKQMECLMQGMVTNPAIYSFGCGPFANDRTVIDSN